jgi:hypothetical protein
VSCELFPFIIYALLYLDRRTLLVTEDCGQRGKEEAGARGQRSEERIQGVEREEKWMRERDRKGKGDRER